jgi:hypothetical protein
VKPRRTTHKGRQVFHGDHSGFRDDRRALGVAGVVNLLAQAGSRISRPDLTLLATAEEAKDRLVSGWE